MDKTLGLRSFVAKVAPQDDNRGLVGCWTSGKAAAYASLRSGQEAASTEGIATGYFREEEFTAEIAEGRGGNGEWVGKTRMIGGREPLGRVEGI